LKQKFFNQYKKKNINFLKWAFHSKSIMDIEFIAYNNKQLAKNKKKFVTNLNN